MFCKESCLCLQGASSIRSHSRQASSRVTSLFSPSEAGDATSEAAIGDNLEVSVSIARCGMDCLSVKAGNFDG